MTIENSIVFNFRKQEKVRPQEGANCSYCKAGWLFLRPPDNCSCHVRAPCANCSNRVLQCTDCDQEYYP